MSHRIANVRTDNGRNADLTNMRATGQERDSQTVRSRAFDTNVWGGIKAIIFCEASGAELVSNCADATAELWLQSEGGLSNLIARRSSSRTSVS